jgi:hypothetical protein
LISEKIANAPAIGKSRLNPVPVPEQLHVLALRIIATLTRSRAADWPTRHDAPRRPLIRLNTIMMMATTRRMWSKPPIV